jgi:hypothetical protein
LLLLLLLLQIREMLSACRIDAVRKSLGRFYSLVAEVQLPSLLQPQQQGLLLGETGIGSSSSSSSSSGSDESGIMLQQQESNSHSSSATPQQLGEWFVGEQCMLNQHPGPGVYVCNVQLYLGATAHDDLLDLQRAAAIAAAASYDHNGVINRRSGSTCSSSGSSSSGNAEPEPAQLLLGLQLPGSSCFAAITASQQQVTVSGDGLVLPPYLAELAAAAFGSYQGVTTSTASCISAAAAAAAGVGCDFTRSSSSSSSSSITDTGMGGGVGVSSSDSSRSRHSSLCEVERAAGDPRCWDTDDNEDSRDDDSDVSRMQALVVLDFVRCARQACSLP